MARTLVTGVAGAVLGIIDGVQGPRQPHPRPFRPHTPPPRNADARPPVDWTGHVYKAASELTVDFDRPRGREAATGSKPQFRPECWNTNT